MTLKETMKIKKVGPRWTLPYISGEKELKLRQKYSLKLVGLLTALFVFSLILTGCSSSKSASKQLNVVATTDFYGETAKAVLGNKGKVTSIINSPNIDPHSFEPTTLTGKQVANANVIVANGVGYDGWMDKLAGNNSSKNYIRVGEDLYGLKNGANPHLWYKPETMPKLANDLATKYSKLQPKNKAYFENNAKKYIKSLAPVNKELNKLKKAAKTSKNKEVYVSEPVFDYALEAIGFKVANPKFEKDTENGVDPSPSSIKTMTSGIKNHKIAFFVFNKQVDSKTVNNFVNLAKQNKIPVLGVTETLPEHENYNSWMISQYQQLNNILK